MSDIENQKRFEKLNLEPLRNKFSWSLVQEMGGFVEIIDKEWNERYYLEIDGRYTPFNYKGQDISNQVSKPEPIEIDSFGDEIMIVNYVTFEGKKVSYNPDTAELISHREQLVRIETSYNGFNIKLEDAVVFSLYWTGSELHDRYPTNYWLILKGEFVDFHIWWKILPGGIEELNFPNFNSIDWVHYNTPKFDYISPDEVIIKNVIYNPNTAEIVTNDGLWLTSRYDSAYNLVDSTNWEKKYVVWRNNDKIIRFTLDWIDVSDIVKTVEYKVIELNDKSRYEYDEETWEIGTPLPSRKDELEKVEQEKVFFTDILWRKFRIDESKVYFITWEWEVCVKDNSVVTEVIQEYNASWVENILSLDNYWK